MPSWHVHRDTFTFTFPYGTLAEQNLLTLNTDIIKRLAAFKRKFLRRMFGGIKVNENWRK
jgi:hypothetical protein